jgi:hypothetical protein
MEEGDSPAVRRLPKLEIRRTISGSGNHSAAACTDFFFFFRANRIDSRSIEFGLIFALSMQRCEPA